jgi:hypothetical protein
MTKFIVVYWFCKKCGKKSQVIQKTPGDTDLLLEIINFDHTLLSPDCEWDGQQVMLNFQTDESALKFSSKQSEGKQ